MARWEHKIEFISLMQTASLQSQAKLSDAAFDRVQAKCSELGAEGWELATMTTMATTAGATATHVIAGFKRAKA
jgi:hypothetical protein